MNHEHYHPTEMVIAELLRLGRLPVTTYNPSSFLWEAIEDEKEAIWLTFLHLDRLELKTTEGLLDVIVLGQKVLYDDEAWTFLGRLEKRSKLYVKVDLWLESGAGELVLLMEAPDGADVELEFVVRPFSPDEEEDFSPR